MEAKCPFFETYYFDMKCPYKDGEMCYNLEVCPGYLDSWCNEKIGEALIKKENKLKVWWNKVWIWLKSNAS